MTLLPISQGEAARVLRELREFHEQQAATWRMGAIRSFREGDTQRMVELQRLAGLHELTATACAHGLFALLPQSSS